MWEFPDVSVSSFSVTVTEAPDTPDTPDRFNDGQLISGEAEPQYHSSHIYNNGVI